MPTEMAENLLIVTDEINKKCPSLPLKPEIKKQFKHGAVLEVTIAGTGANYGDHKAIATGVGIVWAKKDGKFIGGFAAEYVQFYDSIIDDEIAAAEAKLWLTKSLNHELSIRGLEQDGEKELYHNFINITPDNPFAYCLTAIGFLNFKYAEIAK